MERRLLFRNLDPHRASGNFCLVGTMLWGVLALRTLRGQMSACSHYVTEATILKR